MPAPATDEPSFEDAVLDTAFGHGYLVRRAAGGPAPSQVSRWPSTEIGGLTYHCHPRAVLSRSRRRGSDAVTAVLIGHPVDVEHGRTDATAIAESVARTAAAGGPEAAVRQAAYLGGRWTLVLHLPGDRLRVVPDAHATQAVFYCAVGGLAFGSFTSLVGPALGHGPSERAAQMTADIKAWGKKGVTYLPGTVTDVEHVLPLVPNCLLEVEGVRSASPRLRHRRFWPWQERVEERDPAVAHARFAARLGEHTRLLSSLGRTAISLTGGLDSRVTLAQLRPHLRVDTFAFTYLNLRGASPDNGAGRDLFAGNEVAFAAGLQHRVLRWRQSAADSPFTAAHQLSYPHTYVSHGAAHAMWADLPHAIVELQSLGGETGTVFARARTPDPISPVRLAELWLGRPAATDPQWSSVFEEYIDYADIGAETMLGYDHHDLNYWEHRLGKWGYRKFQDGDFSHRLLAPFNDRGLLEIMLSLPEERRLDKTLYTRTLAGHPDLMPSDE